MKMKGTSTGREFAVVILTVIFVALIYNAFSSNGLPLVREAPAKVAVSDQEIFGGQQTAGAPGVGENAPKEPFRVISIDQMRKILDGKKGLVADARTPDEYAAGHLAGAVNLYAMEPENYVERIADLPRDTLVTVYCSNPHCPFARTVAELLGTFGFTNVLLFDGGYDAWTDAGLPVTGPEDGQ